MKNNYYIIDTHCHIYPEKIASKAVAATDKFYDADSYGKGTTADLKETCQKFGIDHALVQSVATTPQQVRSINEFIHTEVKAADGFFTGLGTIHPESEDMKGDIEHLVELGLKGVKIHPDIQRFKLDDYRLLKAYEICEEKNLPILIHTGDNRYDFSNPNRLLPILETYTKLTVIGAHLGGWSIWDTACESYAGLPNFFVDCSSSFYWIDKKTAKEVISRYGADKVMFATDYPMWSAETELEYFFDLGFSDEEYKKMLCENAKNLFNL